jgi:ABC-type nitrate/sulfonate/bicarbonate transport system permease component
VRPRLVSLASVLLGAVAWHLVAVRVGPLLLAEPLSVARAFLAEGPALAEATAQTALAALLAVVASVVVGVGLGAASWASPLVRAASAPWTVGLQVLPIVAVAPMLVVWLGYGLGVAVVTGFVAAFYPMYAATRTGLAAPAEEWVDLVRLHGATPLQELRLVRLPAALPALLSGLRASAGLAVIGAIVGEFVGSNGSPRTLGFLVVGGARAARTDLSFAAIACAALLALGMHGALHALERRLTGSWYGA